MKVQSAAFGEGQIEVSFLQEHNVGDFGMLIETAIFSTEDFPEEMAEIHDAFDALLTQWLTVKRNPPERVRARGV